MKAPINFFFFFIDNLIFYRAAAIAIYATVPLHIELLKYMRKIYLFRVFN